MTCDWRATTSRVAASNWRDRPPTGSLLEGHPDGANPGHRYDEVSGLNVHCQRRGPGRNLAYPS